MKKCNGYVKQIESFGLVDGPGIRTVVFLGGCHLRCMYCHNPEMFFKSDDNMSVDELVDKILRNKPYFKNNGGVTFSGGEPLLQKDFLIEVIKKLKKDNIHVALDTAGVGDGDYEEILSLVDLVLFDVKHTTKEGYKLVTTRDIDKSLDFIESLNKSGKDVWIRQVMVPGIMDNDEYLKSLKEFISKIKNVKKIDFLPYHTMGINKYYELNIPYKLEGVKAMSKEECDKLYEKFMNM